MLTTSLTVFSPGRRDNFTSRTSSSLRDSAMAEEPVDLSIDRDSPVIVDSFTSLEPEIIRPSMTIRELGETLKWSPYCKSRASMTRSLFPSASTKVVVTACIDRIEIDSTARWRAKALTERPTRIRDTRRVLVWNNWPIESGRPETSQA